MKGGRAVISVLLACSAVALGSCSSSAGAYISVAMGNAAYDRGNYQQATVDYMSAAKRGIHPDWISYDLANVYHALGEPDGASEEWAKAEKTANGRLAAATSFNEGILDYELGRYRAAYDKFRGVLEMNPADIDAKVNLELSFQKMQNKQPPRAAAAEGVPVERNPSQVNTMLELIRQREDKYWAPSKQQQAGSNGPDW